MADTDWDIAVNRLLDRAARLGAVCEDGRLMVAKPLFDDPEYAYDIGRCPHCNGRGCHTEPENG